MKRNSLLIVVILLTAGILNAGYSQTYPDTYKTGHFIIHYNADSVPFRKDKSYIPVNKPSQERFANGDPDFIFDPDDSTRIIRSVPYYIIDMGANFEKALSACITLGLASADREVIHNDVYTIKTSVDVYVCRLDPGTDGENNARTGWIYINQDVGTPIETPSQALALQKVCAHELLHYVTSKSYSIFALGLTRGVNFWWWECLASQADRLVFPDNKPFEAEISAMDNNTGIQNIVQDSWDVCNIQPNWYISSAFLSYLMYYRPGPKATFDKIFFYPTKLTNMASYNRSSLNDYVKAELSSNSLGQEYYDYMLWMLEKKTGDSKYFYLKMAEGSVPYLTTVSFKKLDTQYQNTHDLQVPYMALRVLRVIKAGNSTDSLFTIKNLAQEGECKVLVFECKKDERKLMRILDLYSKKDSLNIVFQQGKFTEIGVLSYSQDNSSSAKIELTRYPNFDGTYEGKVEFNPENLEKVVSRYTITISALKFEIKGTGVTCDFEFHKEYPKDGFYAKGVALKGSIDPTGIVHMVGQVSGFTYPKGSLNCCDFPRVKDDPKCMKFVHNPYYWKFDGKVVVEGNKITLKGYIAASINQVKFAAKSEKLYAFSTTKK